MTGELRFIETTETVPYRNLALEEHLFDRVRPGEVVLYLWQNRHTVVIGRNQNAWRECRVELLEEDGGFLARRRSGGGAVFHDLGNLNFTFAAWDEDYDVGRQLGVVIRALEALGVPARQSGRNDICVGEQKISGNAFQHRGGKSCHHGTILIDADMAALGRYLNPSADKLRSKGVASVRSRVANLKDFCPGVTVEEIRRLLRESFSQAYGLPVGDIPPEELDTRAVEHLTREFASWEWRLGRPIPFTHELSRRYPWGDIQLQLEVDRGRVRQAAAFSDALGADFIAALPGALEGCVYNPEALAGAVEALAADGAAQEMAEDIGALIRETLTHGEEA